jgi:predicted patatin/cPLA2 family phospholipase
MALALDDLGLARSFDAAYGSSAGTLNAMWLVSGRVRDGIPTWTDPALVRALIQPRRALRRGPVVDVRTLVEERYEQLSPGLFAAVLASPTELHPVATDVETAQSVDLHARIADARTLRLAVRASAALPFLAGPPVVLGGRALIDAGLSAAIPFHAALADGATHVLVLRSRRAGETVTPPRPVDAALTGRALRRLSPRAGGRLPVPRRARARRRGAARPPRRRPGARARDPLRAPGPGLAGARAARARRRARHRRARGRPPRGPRGPRRGVTGGGG